MNILQIVLLSNAAFSFISGCVLMFRTKPTAREMGFENYWMLFLVGLSLVLFSYTVFRQALEPKPAAIFVIVLLDFAWVFSSFILLYFIRHRLTLFGRRVITGVASIVLTLGLIQAYGLWSVDSKGQDGFKRLHYERNVQASKQATWQLISDVANYHLIAPNIDHVEILSGHGLGMVRECNSGSEEWIETCTRLDEGEAYTFRVNTEADNYPYPLKALTGTWKVKELGEDDSQIIMIFDLVYERAIYNLLLHPFFRKKFDTICQELLDNWERKLR